MTACTKCQRHYNEPEMDRMRMETCRRIGFAFSPCCSRCLVLGIAGVAEMIEEGDTLADISSGEQNGAFFREFAKKL